MAEEKEPLDWLFPEAEAQAAEQQQNGLLFAQRYLVFSGATADPRAVALLKHWTDTVRKKTLAPTASVQEYAAANAFREFIEGIHAQIEFANQGLNQPKRKTT